jgi:hypothetical protein
MMTQNALTLDAWLRQLRPPPDPAEVLEAWLRQLVDRNPVDRRQPSTQPTGPPQKVHAYDMGR